MRYNLLFYILLSLAQPLILLAADSPAATEPAATAVTVDLAAPRQEFRGWGTSLAWWAHGVGDLPDDKLDPIIHLITDPKDGLGLNVFRYNIGGGDAPGHHHMRRWGDIPGYKTSADAAYDWNADHAQRRVLMKLIKASAGKPIVEAFSNSPPWWMTISGCVSGAADGGANLKPEYEQAFTDYLADVAAHFQKNFGVTFDSVEPLNEADATWWKASGGQEGLHIPRDQQARLIQLTRRALDQRGLQQTRVSGTDANSINGALKSAQTFDATTLAALGQINTHTYSGSERAKLRDAAARLGKPLWQSETGPHWFRGSEVEQVLALTQRLITDMNELRPEVWCTWQIIDHGAWGCLHTDDWQTFQPAQSFQVLRIVTAGIRPGDQIVQLESKDVLAAISPARNQLTFIFLNRDKTPHTFHVTLKDATKLPSEARFNWVAGQDTGLSTEPIQAADGALKVIARPQSVTRMTLILPAKK